MIKGLTLLINLNNLNFSENSPLEKKDSFEISWFLLILLNLINTSFLNFSSKKEILDFQFHPYFINNLQPIDKYLFKDKEIIKKVDEDLEFLYKNLSIQDTIDIFQKMNKVFENFETISNLKFLTSNNQKENILVCRECEKNCYFNLNYEQDYNLNKNIENTEISINQKPNIVFLESKKVKNFEKNSSYLNINNVDSKFDKDLNKMQNLQYDIAQFLIKKDNLFQSFADNSELNNKDLMENVFQKNSHYIVSLKRVIKSDEDFDEFNKANISYTEDEILFQGVIEKENKFSNLQILESEMQNKGFELVFQIDEKSSKRFDDFQKIINQNLINSSLSLINNFEIQSQLNMEKININFQNFSEEIVEFIKNIFLKLQPQGVNKVLIRLEPPEMGVLELEIRVKSKEVEIIAKIEKPEVFQEIRQNLNNMKVILENSGMVLKDFQMFLVTDFYNSKMAPYNFGKENRKNNESRYSIEKVENIFDDTIQENNRIESFYNKNGNYYFIV